MAGVTVVDPEGEEWRVRRTWVSRKLRWRGRGGSLDLLDGADLVTAGADLPVVGIVLAVIGLVMVAFAAVIFIVPAVVFIVELLIVVLIVGLGLAGRVLFGRPWTVEARRAEADHVYEWKTRGWGASSELVDTVADTLRSTGIPHDGTRVPPAP